MSDEIHLDGKEYISSKRASELSGYAQDYIGQLARRGYIDAQRVGGLWYVSMSSLTNYKMQADSYTPVPPQRVQANDPESLVSFDGKDHVSAARAAKITGYHQDYVGQLARSGAVLSRQVGNRWYVEREGIIAHKREKDGLLAAVQAESVGLASRRPAALGSGSDYASTGAYLTYTRDDGDLIPDLERYKTENEIQVPEKERLDEVEEAPEGVPVPIRILHSPMKHAQMFHKPKNSHPVKSAISRKTIMYGTLAISALTVVIVLSFGFSTLKGSSVFTTNTSHNVEGVTGNVLTASAAAALQKITKLGDLLEKLLVPELIYRRGQ